MPAAAEAQNTKHVAWKGGKALEITLTAWPSALEPNEVAVYPYAIAIYLASTRMIYGDRRLPSCILSPG